MTDKTLAEKSAELDLRRQAQIQVQIEIINRLLPGESSFDEEMQALVEQLADVRVENDYLQRKVTHLEDQLEKMKYRR